MTSKIEKEVAAINKGIGERLGNVITAVTSLFFGYIFAFYWGWILTCIILAALPLLFGLGLALGIL
jgi:ABC-type multidrug transport system fused ATPase/permease subunit